MCQVTECALFSFSFGQRQKVSVVNFYIDTNALQRMQSKKILKKANAKGQTLVRVSILLACFSCSLFSSYTRSHASSCHCLGLSYDSPADQTNMCVNTYHNNGVFLTIKSRVHVLIELIIHLSILILWGFYKMMLRTETPAKSNKLKSFY